MSRDSSPTPRGWWHGVVVGAAVLGLAAACDADGDQPTTTDGASARRAVPDGTLRVHDIAPGTPTREGLAYVRAAAEALATAEAQTGDERIATLRRGLSLPVPARVGEAEILRMEIAATLGESLLQRPQGAAVAENLLAPMLAVTRSLPKDRATARALVALGDAAVKTGHDAVAAGSYARAIKVMSLLRQELEQ